MKKKKSWPKLHPPTEFEPYMHDLAHLKKIKETCAGNSYHNNSPKNCSKNLIWTKLHPPTEFEPHVTYHFQERSKKNKQAHPPTKKQLLHIII